ncbi:hypothetical protein [Periweissella ghanensis]|uniref:Uncharacterized protein n=1 Tax=Periweissella ghanensis TaxID=467997 RepID=A0ABN8BQA9_9LACO|nr:hypothetical protein [Periweissella ghanensis]MCM0601833.1 hypothetical protein [Periweissella ghanensis]CAH0418820.1 hypothetical protein WGH24286_01262 [Periweissella ghanensis]
MLKKKNKIKIIDNIINQYNDDPTKFYLDQLENEYKILIYSKFGQYSEFTNPDIVKDLLYSSAIYRDIKSNVNPFLSDDPMYWANEIVEGLDMIIDKTKLTIIELNPVNFTDLDTSFKYDVVQPDEYTSFSQKIVKSPKYDFGLI